MLGRCFSLIISITILWIIGVEVVNAETMEPVNWQSVDNPILTKIVDFPSNVHPSTSNIDCIDVTVRVYKTQSMQPDCMVRTPYGQIGASGVVFNSMSEAIPVVPQWPRFGLQPIPNNTTLISYSSAPVVGLYLHFFTSIRDKMSLTPQQTSIGWHYTITGQADYILKDLSGRILPVNPNTMAFSPNGQWMVVDLPWQGYVRINLKTFEVKPFAPSLQLNNDYSSRLSHVAISNDGLKVALKPNDYNYFKIYNLSNCNNSTMPINQGTDPCISRDFYGYIETKLAGLKAIYQLRFINDSQISLVALHDYSPGKFKVTKYTLTAPGSAVTGIQYLGLGDSFASGEGAHSYAAGTDTVNNTCHLSNRSYGFLLSSHIYSDGRSVACSGAVTKDVLDNSGAYKGQVKDGVTKDKRTDLFINSVIANYTPGYISQTEFIDQYEPEIITLSIGGNDIGFADIIQSCVSPVALPESCFPSYEDRLELAMRVNGIFDRLVDTYTTVLKPGKRVYVVGYPQIALPGGNCAANVHLDAYELRMAADLIEYLNLVVKSAADRAGVRYVDVSQAFVGHRLCETQSSDIAVNGFTAGRDSGIGSIKFIGSESYHPNALGHALYEQTIRTQTDELTQLMPTPNLSARPPALPTSLNDQNLPKTGRQTNTVIASDKLTPKLIVRGQELNITLDSAITALKAFTQFKLVMHSVPTKLGVAMTDNLGNLSATFTVPTSLTPGFHTLHLYGQNIVGQPIDITKTVYVAASDNDYDGNGMLNIDDSCVFLTGSGVDSDLDGIDDACDGSVGVIVNRPNTVKLTGSTITIVRP